MDDFSGDAQMLSDVRHCLFDAMTDPAGLNVSPSEIEPNTVPADLGVDDQGWGICLQDYAARIRAWRPAYASYGHKPRYAVDTLNKTFEAIVPYLKDALAEQVG
jgi:hypothetical protein